MSDYGPLLARLAGLANSSSVKKRANYHENFPNTATHPTALYPVAGGNGGVEVPLSTKTSALKEPNKS
jgi:hypothetical protein